jgi:high-affinity iron transporter
MLSTLAITLREGIEAFLIVAITLAYLRKTGRTALVPAVYWSTGIAIMLSLILAMIAAEFVATPFNEGMLALVAAVLVASMIVYMLKAAKHLRAEIGRKIELAMQKPPMLAQLGVFAFVLLMVTREGVETALLLLSLSGQTDAAAMIQGGVLGVILAALLALAWARYGHRINLGLFFQATSIFLALFVLQLIFYAFHEFTEAGALPLDNAYWHIATEPWAPEGEYGQWLSYALVLCPALWLLYIYSRNKSQTA